MRIYTIAGFAVLSLLLLTPVAFAQTDPDTAPVASIDRFSMEAGTLFVRDEANGLPDANEPIDFDQGEPFRTQGFGPDGETVQYYNFDVQSTAPAPIFVLFREGEMAPVEGQLNVVDDIPGDDDYNDFWQVVKVTVPSTYVANTVTSFSAIETAGYTMEPMSVLVNCPIVPEGSTATLRFNESESAELTRGWYRDEVVYYFNFGEAPLMTTAGGEVPVSPIYVAFNINPDQMGGGPPSGFMTEADGVQTHNVVATLPGDAQYSPLWVVNIYDNAAFGTVSDLATAQAAPLMAAGAALVNCPIVSVDMTTAVETLPGEVPTGFELHENYPNPFNPETTIRYELNEGGRVRLSVYSILGQKVVDLVEGRQASGVYQVTWDGRDDRGRLVASGIYIYRLTMDGRTSRARVMTLLK